jgi:hypothetical protein
VAAIGAACGSRHFNLICSRRLFGTAAAGAPHQIAAAPIISLAVGIGPVQMETSCDTQKSLWPISSRSRQLSDLYPTIGGLRIQRLVVSAFRDRANQYTCPPKSDIQCGPRPAKLLPYFI